MQESLEAYRTTKGGLRIFMRSVEPGDDRLVKDFLYSLSDECMYNRFISMWKDMSPKKLQQFLFTNYNWDVMIVAMLERHGQNIIVGIGQYVADYVTHTAEVAFLVRDQYQNKGIGTELLSYLTAMAKRNGLFAFTASVLVSNKPMLHLFEKFGFTIERYGTDIYELKMSFEKS